MLDTIYYDEETGLLMQSITVQGGDVDQIPYDGPDIMSAYLEQYLKNEKEN